jgi:hypothetical protein
MDRDPRGRFTKAEEQRPACPPPDAATGWDVKALTYADFPSLEWEPFALDDKGWIWSKRYRPAPERFPRLLPPDSVPEQEDMSLPLWKRMLRFVFWQGDE